MLISGVCITGYHLSSECLSIFHPTKLILINLLDKISSAYFVNSSNTERILGLLKNTLKSVLKPLHAKSVFQKIIDRLTDTRSSVSQEYKQWLAGNALAADEYLQSIDPEIWLEAQQHYISMQKDAELAMQAIDVKLGGAGDTMLLYWLVRKLRPTYILETAVAAGFSSHAMLSAIDMN